MDSPLFPMDYEGIHVYYFLINSTFLIKILLDEFDVSDPTIELPNNIWEVMVNLHKKLLTAIPKIKRSYWTEEIDDFYITYFRNLKPKLVTY